MASATPQVEVPKIEEFDGTERFYATRYKQGTRTVYSLDLSLAQVGSLIRKPDHTKTTHGNRAIRLNHAKDFATYLRTRPDWVAPSIILRAPGIFKFEAVTDSAGADFGVLAFKRLDSTEINILDGQHRILGIHLANEAIAEERDAKAARRASARSLGDDVAVEAADQLVKELDKQKARLSSERINVQIHVVEDPVAYMQMFFDIADNALGITASVKTRFDNRKVVNRAMEAVTDHPLLRGMVESERDFIGRSSPYFMSARHVAELIRASNVGIDGRVSRRQEAELDHHDVANTARKFLDVLVDSFPLLRDLQDKNISAEELRRSGLLGSILVIRILAGVYYELTHADRGWSDERVAEFFKTLAPHMVGPAHENSIWRRHAGDYFDEDAMAPYSRRQSIVGITREITEWAILDVSYPKAKPRPRPKTDDELEQEMIDSDPMGYLAGKE